MSIEKTIDLTAAVSLSCRLERAERDLTAANARVAELEHINDVFAAGNATLAAERDAALARAEAAERERAEADTLAEDRHNEVLHAHSLADAAESEAAALRAEVEDMSADLSKVSHLLHAANSLLERCLGYAPAPYFHEIAAAIRAHLSGQAPARTDHERAVLEAMAAVHHGVLRVVRRYFGVRFPAIDGVIAAEFARRGASR